MRSIFGIVYLVIGLLVAAQKDYLGDIGSVSEIINLLLAILLWPLVLLGVKFNIKMGGDGDGGRDRSLLVPAALAQLQQLWTRYRKTL